MIAASTGKQTLTGTPGCPAFTFCNTALRSLLVTLFITLFIVFNTFLTGKFFIFLTSSK